MSRIIFITSVFVFTLLQCIVSQAKGENNVQFYNLNEEYGISFRETNDVCGDQYGFIWISSKMGIIRYTENDIRIYKLPYESVDVIYVGLTYNNDDLYAYTNNGQIFKYNLIQDKFELVINISDELQNQYILVGKLLVDNQSKIWIASTFGLFSYEKGAGLKSAVPDQSVQYLDWYDETHFFYASNGQIRLFNTEDLSNEIYQILPQDNNYFVFNLYYDHSEKCLWVGTMNGGLLKLSSENGNSKLQIVKDIPNQPVLALESNSDSTLLVGIDGQGMWEIHKKTNEVISVYKEDSDNPNSLRGNGVYGIYFDQNERVWICTYSGGVSFFDQVGNSVVTKIAHIINNNNSLVNNDVNSVMEDSDGNLWFATNNGVSYWNTKTNLWKSFYHNKKEQAQVFLTINEDNEGRIWVGSYSSGVYVLDRRTGNELAHYWSQNPNVDFDSDFIFDIMKDREGNMWIGGVRGDLICFLNRENRFVSYTGFTVYVMCEYAPDKLLLGTTNGLILFDKNTGEQERLVDNYLINDIYLKDDLVWIATSGEGILRYDIKNKTLDRFTTDNGLPSNFVNSIEYSNGSFFIGSEQGLCSLNEADNTILTYNSLLYLSHVSFNMNAHKILKNGKLLMGTNNGALIFEPSELKSIPEEGHIYFQDISVAGRSIREIEEVKPEIPIDELQEIKLKYYQNTISLEVVPIRVKSPGSRFSWMIDGLDDKWSQPGNNRIISYSSIPEGTYTLKIRMLNSSFTKILAERSLDIKIVPPFRKTVLFRLLVLFFIVGISIFGFLLYIHRLKQQHSEEKIRFFANTAHDMRTSLTLINGPIEELNKETGLTNQGFKYLDLATDQVHRLSLVVTQLMDFQKVDIGKERLLFSYVNIVKLIENRVLIFDSLAKSKNITLEFNSNVENYETSVDETIIEKVVDNLLSNAIKYSYPYSKVIIDVRCLSNKWIMEVRDTGIGISKKAQRMLFREYYRGNNAINSKIVGSGIGLLLVKNYVSMHGGKITCESHKNHGSTFQVSIPYNKKESGKTESRVVKNPVQQMNPKRNIVHLNEEIIEPAKQKMKVLIVEDHEYLREFLKTAMQSQFNIYMAENGLEAWEFIQKESPDLVVSDIMMPKMDGYELCERIKSTYETSHIPLILLTSLTGKAQELHGLGLGADDYLTKPFDVTLLQQRIKTLIQNREIVREKALKIIKQSDDTNEVILDNELNDLFVKRMVDVVRKNMTNQEFSKDDFAAKMNVSSSLLYKKVKSLTNLSPTDFIKSIRLDYALELLKSKKYTITEISELSGFSSVGYFGKVFRKHYGKSPTQIE